MRLPPKSVVRISFLKRLTFLPCQLAASTSADSNTSNSRNQSDQPKDPQFKSKTLKPIVLEKTPKGRLDDNIEERHRDAEKEPLPRWPNEENPHTGEKGGPAGPEPTRFGDWERKGRVTDF